MRHTFSAWRSTSTAPMYTVHSRPNSAAAVAVATPCCPAPVSAITRCLPMRRVSSACPSTLLILCEPVCVRSSRFEQHAHAEPLREPLALGDGRRPARVGREQVGVLGAELVVGPRGAELALELLEGGDQRLGHEAPAELAEPARARPARGREDRGARAHRERALSWADCTGLPAVSRPGVLGDAARNGGGAP